MGIGDDLALESKFFKIRSHLAYIQTGWSELPELASSQYQP